MPIPAAVARIVFRGMLPALFAVTGYSRADQPTPTPLENEGLLIARAHAAARADEDSTIDAQLDGLALGSVAERSASVLFARRAMAVCGWLQNENDRRRATILARRVIVRLSRMTESNDADRAERLIWEATIEAQILDNKKQALALLQSAEELAPGDPRITGMKPGLTAALDTFGH